MLWIKNNDNNIKFIIYKKICNFREDKYNKLYLLTHVGLKWIHTDFSASLSLIFENKTLNNDNNVKISFN